MIHRILTNVSPLQYQPLAYSEQLLIKQSVVRKAFANFSGLDASLIPQIGPTLPSPLQYSYRTKLTPHFQSPPTGGNKANGGRKGKGKGRMNEVAVEEEPEEKKEWELTIGFEEKGRKRIVDIEECVIATQVINRALTVERKKVQECVAFFPIALHGVLTPIPPVRSNIASYKRGATILLRDSLPPRPEGDVKPSTTEILSSSEEHICITDHHATVREQIGTVEFEQIAGSFFQNNNSILPSLLSYIADSVRPEGSPARDPNVKSYLVDAVSLLSFDETLFLTLTDIFLFPKYCGSGLFAISLADQFDKIEGVEIDKNSVKWAKLNAEYNKGEGRGEVGFSAGNAEAIFGVSPGLPFIFGLVFFSVLTGAMLYLSLRPSTSLPPKRQSSSTPREKGATLSSFPNSSRSAPLRSST